MSGLSIYGIGFKYCHNCDETFFQSELHCMCCGLRLRTKPRSKKGKEYFENTKQFILDHKISIRIRQKYELSNLDFIDAKDALVENFRYAYLTKKESLKYKKRQAKIQQVNSLDYRIFKYFRMIDRLYSQAMKPVKLIRYQKKQYDKRMAFKRFWQLVENQ